MTPDASQDALPGPVRGRPRQSVVVKRILGLVPPIVFLATVALLFASPGRDDLYISLWPAHTLVEEGALLNYNAEPVEQSSSLLWVLVLAAFHTVLPTDLASLARLLSIGAALLCFPLLRLAERRLTPRGSGALAPWLLAVQPPFVYWAASGMEASLAALALLGAFVAVLKDLRSARAGSLATATAIVAVAAARPEGGALILAAGAALLAATFASGRSAGSAADAGRRSAIFVIACVTTVGVGLLLFRLAYFGSPVAQPVLAKTEGWPPLWKLARGADYLLDSLAPYLLPIAVYALGEVAASLADWVRGRAFAPARILAAALVLAGLGFIVVSGGDWMELGRFLVPVAPLLALLASLGLRRVGRASLRRALLLVGIAGGLAGLYAAARPAETQSLPSWRAGVGGEALRPDRFSWLERSNKTQLRDIPLVVFLDYVLRSLPPESAPVQLWSYQMGFAPYHLTRSHPGRVRWLDLLGLTDRTISSCAPLAPHLLHESTGLMPRRRLSRQAEFYLEEVGVCTDAAPDLIYLLGPAPRALLREHGFLVVFEESGLIDGRPSYQYVAMRSGLVAALGLEERRIVIFKDRPEGPFVSVRYETLKPL